ncbi:MAG: hypothetical protein K0R93_2042 [Anaerosolibacter sp.]|uniref:nucleotidyltransferase family protein n=1 Tax=Anaerosolibacter sp. TaxID=1872527 RepID=UPI00261CB583|nr:nucleotidyltransferase family protein [Anaerosolibacter sp.]MDF2547144.1 hypothetical protein [Anaerosolibacter sp.]
MIHQILNAYNLDAKTQIEILEKIIMSSNVLHEALHRTKTSDIKEYYIGAGCIAQTVWNYLSNNHLDYGIDDIDFVYFDKDNLEDSAEDEVIKRVGELYSDLQVRIDVKNQARVHLWYESSFGYTIPPYKSLEQAIDRFPTTATAIGIRLGKDDKFQIYAPFGLNDVFGKIVRPNKGQITEEIYNRKVEKWLGKWPDLKIISWNN